MAKALVVYGSTTGNTEYVAGVAERALGKSMEGVTKIDASSASAKGLCDGYDLILFGCSTWGDDSIELQDDFIPLFENFAAINAKDKNVAVFGCGDSSYSFFCGAVDAIEKRLEELGANVIDTLKIDGDPQSESAEIEAWVEQVAKKAA